MQRAKSAFTRVFRRAMASQTRDRSKLSVWNGPDQQRTAVALCRIRGTLSRVTAFAGTAVRENAVNEIKA